MSEEYQVPEARKKIIWIIWSALLMSQAVYTGVAFVVKMPPSPDPNFNNTFGLVLGVVSLATAGLATVVIPGLLIKQAAATKNPAERYFVYFIVRCVLAEAICIYGLTYKMTGGHINYFFMFLGLSVALFLLFAPTDKDQENFFRKVKQARS